MLKYIYFLKEMFKYGKFIFRNKHDVPSVAVYIKIISQFYFDIDLIGIYSFNENVFVFNSLFLKMTIFFFITMPL